MCLAVFVDGENIGADHAPAIWSIALAFARPTLSRVYGDATKLAKWEEEPCFNLVHAGKGKNATDLLLCVEAMEAALTGGCDSVLIASSDKDFSHLAQRLREKGRHVIGVGEAKTNPKFRAACSVFHTLAARPVAAPAPPPARALAPETKPALALVPKVAMKTKTKLDDKIREIIAKASPNGAGMDLVKLSNQVHAEHKTLASTRKEKTWRSYFGARPHLYAVDPKGASAKVRFVTAAPEATAPATG